MAGAALVVRFIIVSSNINNCPGCDVQIAILEKKRFFFPFINLHLAGDIDSATPIVAAQCSMRNLIYPDLLPVDFNQLFSWTRFVLSSQ